MERAQTTRKHLVLVLCLASLSIFPAFAASSGQPSPPAGSIIGGLVVWYICAKRKAREIGGWLLYLYIQLYVGVLIALFLNFLAIRNYLPSSWASNPGLYPLFLLSAAPGLIILLIQAVVAERLRRSRDVRFLRMLRTVFWIDLASVGVSFLIDSAEFRDSLPLDALHLIWPAIWLPYLYFSKRVKRVFETRDWIPAVPARQAVQ